MDCSTLWLVGTGAIAFCSGIITHMIFGREPDEKYLGRHAARKVGEHTRSIDKIQFELHRLRARVAYLEASKELHGRRRRGNRNHHEKQPGGSHDRP